MQKGVKDNAFATARWVDFAFLSSILIEKCQIFDHEIKNIGGGMKKYWVTLLIIGMMISGLLGVGISNAETGSSWVNAGGKYGIIGPIVPPCPAGMVIDAAGKACVAGVQAIRNMPAPTAVNCTPCKDCPNGQGAGACRLICKPTCPTRK